MAIKGNLFAERWLLGCKVAGCADGSLGEDDRQRGAGGSISDLTHVVHAKDVVRVAADSGGGRVIAGPGGLGGIGVCEAEYLQSLEQSR